MARTAGSLVIQTSAGRQPPFWPHFNGHGNQKMQLLTPPALLTPQGPHPFATFTTEHFCPTWEPLLTFNNGNEPQQP